MKPLQYPFSAIVGQESMKTALILNAVDPSIGGVLIRGHKGTGKTTAARALAQLLPKIEVVEGCPFNSSPEDPVDPQDFEIKGRCRHRGRKTASRPTPFVELPLNATADRVVGSLHVERALQTGKRSFEPGLLAAANRGILYVDEVNLLDDHLVDILLDAAASGINIIEREGISFAHPARFMLIGTMNPEEGELRPQFLDRFGLCAVVHGIGDPGSREAIVRRHLAFAADPEDFLLEWKRADDLLSDQIVRARTRLDKVEIPAGLMNLAVDLTQRLEVQGHRADITLLKAARAHAAFLERPQVEKEDVSEAARLAVPHRMKSSPLDKTDDLLQRIDRALRGSKRSADPLLEDRPEDVAEQMQVPGSMAAGSILFSFLAARQKEKVFEADPAIGASEIEVRDLLEVDGGEQGKSRSKTVAGSGLYRRAVPVEPGEEDYDIALDATLRQAALRRVRRAASTRGRLALKREDLRKKQYVQSCKSLIVFVVDASDSMGSGAAVRMKAAKGAALAILRRAYQSRSKVAMVSFAGEKARIVLPPTSSTDVARRSLENLPTGGATPFADGLMEAWRLIRSARLKNPALRPVMAVISDGEANVPLAEGASPMEELGALAEQIGQEGIRAVFIDAAPGPAEQRGMRDIADRMRATYVTMRELTAPRLLKAVRRLA